MVNQIVLVGRIARTPETKTSETGKKYATLLLQFLEIIRIPMVNMILIFWIVHYGLRWLNLLVNIVKLGI